MDILNITPVVATISQYNRVALVNQNNDNQGHHIEGYSTYSISGNAMTPSGVCLRVLFINSDSEMESSIIPNSNGDFIYYCKNDTYTVIMVGPSNIETKVLYNVHPLNTNINIH